MVKIEKRWNLKTSKWKIWNLEDEASFKWPYNMTKFKAQKQQGDYHSKFTPRWHL